MLFNVDIIHPIYQGWQLKDKINKFRSVIGTGCILNKPTCANCTEYIFLFFFDEILTHITFKKYVSSN